MYALINKLDLSVTQLFEVFYNGFDSESFVQIEVPEGLNLRFLKAVDNEGIISIEEDTVAKIAADKASRVASLNIQTWSTIMTQAKVVYGSDDPVLVLASHSTYQAMLETPSAYVGDIFPSVEVVQAFAGPKLDESNAFGKWRLGILAAEAAQKAAILAE